MYITSRSVNRLSPEHGGLLFHPEIPDAVPAESGCASLTIVVQPSFHKKDNCYSVSQLKKTEKGRILKKVRTKGHSLFKTQGIFAKFPKERPWWKSENLVDTRFFTPEVCFDAPQTSPDVNGNISNFKALLRKALKCEFLVDDSFALNCSGIMLNGESHKTPVFVRFRVQKHIAFQTA